MDMRLKLERYNHLKEAFDFALTRYRYAPSYEAKMFVWNELVYYKTHIKKLERELSHVKKDTDDDSPRGA